ncbi:TadE/TadG family type IV pilus assembly protein [Novosphingobium aquimarinum]|uniref:TadE/TadG family type IV pilus assembly protein n=1 Tax=Novosphingobium aquimarinum TaxID=2682494 RepID=UPI0018DCD21C|nr:TadE family protein [Novosphingobium aquimarinum]
MRHALGSRTILSDDRGISAVEFALLAPVLLIMLMGIFDMSYSIYTNALLEGAVQKAARDSTIEAADLKSDELDGNVTAVVRDLVPNAQLTFDRTSYSSFGDVGQAEDFDDVDANGACNDGESFEDANGNGIWDADRGKAGLGAARDAVLYEVSVTYLRPFPVAKLVGFEETMTMMTRTVLRNQPYGGIEVEPEVRTCL